MDFIYRVQSYHDYLQEHSNRIEMDINSIREHNFITDLPVEVKNSDIIGCSFSTESSNHIISVLKLRDQDKNITGYKIFDPNYGEILCATELAVNQQVNLLFQYYQSNRTNKKSVFSVTALDEIVTKHELVYAYSENLTEEEKAVNEAKKYKFLSDKDKFHLSIESDRTTEADTNKTIEIIKNMSVEEINEPILLASQANSFLLYMAAKAGKLELVKLLIEKGAIVDVQGRGGHTPLNVAASNGHVEVMQVLLEAGANIDTVTEIKLHH